MPCSDKRKAEKESSIPSKKSKHEEVKKKETKKSKHKTVKSTNSNGKNQLEHITEGSEVKTFIWKFQIFPSNSL